MGEVIYPWGKQGKPYEKILNRGSHQKGLKMKKRKPAGSGLSHPGKPNITVWGRRLPQ
jgi:hypothetical protein